MEDQQEIGAAAMEKFEPFMMAIKETTRSHCEARIQSLVSAFKKRRYTEIDSLLQSSKSLVPRDFFSISLSSQGVLTMETRLFCPMAVSVSVYSPEDESAEMKIWEGYFQGKVVSVDLSSQLPERPEEGFLFLVLTNRGVVVSNVLKLT